MSALDAARKAVEAAQAKLATATRKAEAEQQARTERNRARRAEFWTNAGERCAAAQRAASEAQAAVGDLVASGDIPAALTAYGEYVRRVAEHVVLVSGAKDATATYVWNETRQVDPNDRARKEGSGYHVPETERVELRRLVVDYNREHAGPPPHGYRTEYGAGVPTQAAERVPFERLLADGVKRLAAEHGAAFRADYMRPLTEALEAED